MTGWRCWRICASFAAMATATAAVELVPLALSASASALAADSSRVESPISSQLHLKTRRDEGEIDDDNLPSKAPRSLKVVSQMDHRLRLLLLEFHRSRRVIASRPLGAVRS